MRPVVLSVTAIIVLAVAACGDDSADAPAPAPTDTPLSAPTAPASAAPKAPASAPTVTPVMAVAVEVAPAPTQTQPSTPTQVPTPAPTSTHTPKPTPVPTDTPTSSPTATETPSPVATQLSTAAPTLVPVATDTAVPTATHTATATNTPVPTATQTPVPTATSLPISTPTPTPTNTPVPTPSVDPALAGYSPLLVEAVSSYLSELDFVGDGLSPEEKDILDWADSRLFTNPNFLASRYGPDNWPSDVKLASVQAVPQLMLAIDVQKKSDGKHVISWEVDSLDRILDELGVYEGLCTSCYGKNDYDTRDKVRANYEPIVNDQGHVHREMLKTFAYLAKADGEDILVRSFMENDSDDFELLYKRDPSPFSHDGRRFSKSRTDLTPENSIS